MTSRLEIEDTGMETFYFYSPYNQTMVEFLRKIPEDCRHWDSENNRWEVDSDYMEALLEAAAEIYGIRPKAI